MANCCAMRSSAPGLSFAGKFVSGACSTKRAARRRHPFQRVEPCAVGAVAVHSMIVTQGDPRINVAVFVAMLLGGLAMLDNPSGQDLVHWEPILGADCEVASGGGC